MGWEREVGGVGYECANEECSDSETETQIEKTLSENVTKLIIN